MIALLLLVALAIVLVVIRSQSEKKQNPEQAEKPAETKSETWMGAFNAYDKAFNTIKKNPFFAVLFSATLLAGHTVSVTIQGQPSPGHTYIPYEYVVYMLMMLLLPAYSLAVVDGKNSSFGSLFRRPLRTFVFLIIAGLLADLIIVFSMVLLIIPIIWTFAWFFFVCYIVMDKNLGPIKALKESKRLAKNHKGKVWGLVGVGFLIGLGTGILSLIPSGQVIVVALNGAISVWSSVTGAVLYRWLQTQQKSVK